MLENTAMARALDHHAKAPSTVESQLFVLQAAIDMLQTEGWTVRAAFACEDNEKGTVLVEHNEALLRAAMDRGCAILNTDTRKPDIVAALTINAFFDVAVLAKGLRLFL